jgi:hypothetical protein
MPSAIASGGTSRTKPRAGRIGAKTIWSPTLLQNLIFRAAA